eukprot:6064127-Prymnesium_polylepis.1
MSSTSHCETEGARRRRRGGRSVTRGWDRTGVRSHRAEITHTGLGSHGGEIARGAEITRGRDRSAFDRSHGRRGLNALSRSFETRIDRSKSLVRDAE